MSFCYDCSDRGYDMCFCKPIKQPNIKFVSEIDTIKKLQEENKTMREALEFYATEKDWDFYCGCCADGSTKLEKDHGKLAREALAKVGE